MFIVLTYCLFEPLQLLAGVSYIDFPARNILLQVVVEFLPLDTEALVSIEDGLGPIHADHAIDFVAEMKHMC